MTQGTRDKNKKNGVKRPLEMGKTEKGVDERGKGRRGSFTEVKSGGERIGLLLKVRAEGKKAEKQREDDRLRWRWRKSRDAERKM